MIHYRSEDEIDLIRESSLLVANTHAEISALIKPGVTTLQLDKIAEEFIRDNGGLPAFKGYSGFPNTLCTSLNEQVVHGIPNDNPLNEGDIISVDCGVLMNGYYGDSAYTYEVGEISKEVKNLLIRTKESLYSLISFKICLVLGINDPIFNSSDIATEKKKITTTILFMKNLYVFIARLIAFLNLDSGSFPSQKSTIDPDFFAYTIISGRLPVQLG